MKKSLTKSATLNALTSYANFAVSSILAFALSPLLARHLGIVDFGIWKACQKYLDFATIADGRATQALKFVVANKEGNDSTVDEKRQAVGSALVTWLLFCPILLVIVGIIVWSLPASINNLDPAQGGSVRLAGALLGLNIVLNPLLGIPDAILVGINESHKSTTPQTLWLIVANIMMVVAAALGWGIVGMAVVTVVTTLLKGVSVLIVCKKNTAWFGVMKPRIDQVKSFLGFSFGTLIWSFISLLLLSSETLLLGSLFGPDDVSRYTFSSYIAQLGASIALVTTSAVIPGLGTLLGRGEVIRSQQVIQLTRRVAFALALIFGCCMLSMNRGFVERWVGPDYYIGDSVNIIIVALMFQLIHLRNEAQIQDITLRIKNKVIVGAIGSPLAIGIAVAAYYCMGRSMTWMLAGLFVGRLVLSFSFPRMVNMISGNKIRPSWAGLTAILMLVLSWLIAPYMVSASWWLLILKGGVLSLLIGALVYFLIFRREDRVLIQAKVANFSRR